MQVLSAVTGKCKVCFVTAPFILALRVIAGAKHLILFGARQLLQLCFFDETQCNVISYSFYKVLKQVL